MKRQFKKKAGMLQLVFSMLLVCCMLVGCASTESTSDKDVQNESVNENTETTDVITVITDAYADIEIEGYGTISVALDGEAAPITVENFVKLAESGFYDGLTFHRIMADFMMQGGDPNGNGTGGSGETIEGEFAQNGYENPLSHTRGVISMARSMDYNSASSQFFIVHKDSTFLDGSYAAFGYVTEGMDVVDQICEEAQPTDNNGSIPAEAQPVIKTITIREASEDVTEEKVPQVEADVENQQFALLAAQAKSINESLENEILTQAEMNEVSAELYATWDAALNLVWSELKEEMPDDEFSKLLEEQRTWVSDKEKAVAEAGAGYESGSMYALIVNMEAANITEKRVYELYEIYQQLQ